MKSTEADGETRFCRTCERVAGEPSDRYGDPEGLCWPCFDALAS